MVEYKFSHTVWECAFTMTPWSRDEYRAVTARRAPDRADFKFVKSLAFFNHAQAAYVVPAS
jgi:hypothetical protein